ncbi:DMT family transporter [Citreimonas sp.]|uniref:DMT family transporter n=1 Tax=Citreimonas sp. TaxID=3036715 RepID=UPI004058EEB6
MTSLDRPLLGIALMLGFCVLAPMGDALAKLLGPHAGVTQLVALRFGIQALILLPIVALTARPWRMTPRIAVFVAMRTVLHIGGIAGMFTALLYLPLADAIAIAFVMPFIALMLGHWLLGEEVGWRRVSACAVGFAGTLLVVQPAFEDVGWPALLPLAVAVVFALFMLVTRRIARETDAVAMQAVSSLMALVLLLPPLALPVEAAGVLTWQPLSAASWALVVAMGTLGTLAHLLMTWSLRFAPASTLAPMQYIEIPVATVVGYVIFADLPGPMAGLGIAITVAAGLYVVMRERAILRAARPAPIAAPPGAPPAG